MSAINILTLLLQEPKLEEKRFMHLQSLVPVPFLAIPVSKWPPASKWLSIKKPNGVQGFSSANIEIYYEKKHLIICFEENHQFEVDIETEIPTNATESQCFGKNKIITSSIALEQARNNYVVNHFQTIQNTFLTTAVEKWLRVGWTLTTDRKIVVLSYKPFVLLKVGVDFVSMRFNHQYAGRFYTPHNVRLELFSSFCKTFAEAINLGRNDYAEVASEPHRENNNLFTMGKHCPAISFVNSETASPPTNIRGRPRCEWQLNIPYTLTTTRSGQKHKKWTVLWTAPMGSGKSHAIREVLKKNPTWKVLVISVRIALTNSFMEDFEKDGVPGFVSYQEKRGMLHDNRLIVQIDSLKRVNNLKKFDLLILDESQSLTAHFAAETFENAAQVFESFKRCILLIPRVIAMDADMDKYNIDRTQWLIQNILNRPATIIRSSAKNDYRRYVRVPSQNDLMYRICTLIELNKRVVIVSNNKTFPKEVHHLLAKRFKDKKGLAIYNEPGHAWNDCIDGRMIRKNNPNDFNDLSWLAYSPVVSPGVSFDYDEFNVICAAASPSEHASGVRFFAQLCNRVREIKDGVVFYHIPPKSPFHFESNRWVDIRNEYNKRNSLQKDFVNNFSKVIDQQQGMAEVSEDEMDEDIVRNAPIQMASKSFNTLWCKIELEARTSITHFEREFRKAKEQDGGTFYYLTPGENDVQQIKDIKKNRTISKKELKELEMKNILEAPTIAHERWTQLKDKRNLSVVESFQVKKFEFCYFNGIDQNDGQLQEHLEQLGSYNPYDEDIFINVLLPQQVLKDYDMGKLGNKVNKHGKRVTYANINKKLSSVKTAYIIDILQVLGMNNILDIAYYDSETTMVDLSKVREIINTIKTDPDASRRFKASKLIGLDNRTCWTFLCAAFNTIAKDMGVGTSMKGVREKRKWSLSHTYAKKKWQINPVYIQKLKYVLLKLKVKNRFWWGEHIDETIQTQIVQLLNEETVETMDNTINAPRLKRELSTNNTEQQPKKNKIEGSSNNNAINLTSNNNAINLTHNNNVINLT